MVEVTKRYFCDLCKKEVIPNPLMINAYTENPLIELDFDLYDDEISICETCAREVEKRLEELSGDYKIVETVAEDKAFMRGKE